MKLESRPKLPAFTEPIFPPTFPQHFLHSVSNKQCILDKRWDHHFRFIWLAIRFKKNMHSTIPTVLLLYSFSSFQRNALSKKKYKIVSRYFLANSASILVIKIMTFCGLISIHIFLLLVFYCSLIFLSFFSNVRWKFFNGQMKVVFGVFFRLYLSSIKIS
jgi:hypothetical protein